MAEWFCHVTCINKVYLIVFFSYANMVLHHWDYCWKCEFDINAKIESYNHHDGEQLLFYKKVQIETQCKKKDVLLVIFILLQEMKNSIFFLYKNVKFHNSTWRKLFWMNRNWTGKFQVSTTITNYYFLLTFPETNCALTVPKPLRKKYLYAFWENEGKIHDGGCVKELFFITD